ARSHLGPRADRQEADPAIHPAREELQLLGSARRRGDDPEARRRHRGSVRARRRHHRPRGPRAVRAANVAPENIHIERHKGATRRDDGTVVASSVTAGAPNRVEIGEFRLYPIHLRAKVTVTGLDLALARLYLPRDAPVLLDRGRASSVLDVTFDA